MNRQVRSWMVSVLISVLELITMATTQAQAPAVSMTGPDFAFGTIASWSEAREMGGTLLFQDGTRWRLLPTAPNYDSMREFVQYSLEHDRYLFVSGDQASGIIHRIVMPKRLAAQEVVADRSGNRFAVLFYGPPSVYYLRNDRPWSATALGLLRKSATNNEAFIDKPDLLVSIDIVTSEIMDVRPNKK